MTCFVFPSRLDVIPESASPSLCEVGLERLARIAGETPVLGEILAAEGGPQNRLIRAVLGGSPFLSQCLLAEPATAADAFARGPAAVFADLCAEVRSAPEAGRAELTARLRRFKRRAALVIALADIAGAMPLDGLTAMISDVAETALDLAVAHLLAGIAPAAVPATAGYVLLGMGKLGARELNYSSDIDLISLYDPDRAEAAGIADPRTAFIRMTRDLVTLMEARTADGYVFRTDLRLRPDPGSTAIVLSTVAAEAYYESFGQNWERAAMIKARPVAGDRTAGEDFLKTLRPFVWRKSLDFAAIQDIHSIKRQISAGRGGTTMEVPGHNVKLGRGGIREIEFFAQTQQLIWGGRLTELRQRRTVDALDGLGAIGHVDTATVAEMKDSYAFLRRVEHRLQMIDDTQTQTLPRDAESLRHLSVFLGYADAAAFSRDLLAHLHRVEDHYSALFADAPELSSEGGNLVFTGAEDDPDTIATLKGMGYAEPEAVARSIRAWHTGRYRAVRSARARELLTELVPALLTALARSARPDEAFRQFDSFLSNLPTGVQLFNLFFANPQVMEALAGLLGDAPRLAGTLSRNPGLLDNLLSPEFFRPPEPVAETTAELARALDLAADYEDMLNIARRFAKDRSFQIGVQLLQGAIDAPAAGRHFSDLAEAVLKALLPEVEADFALRHGRIEGGAVAVLAMGRLGSREMTPTSDLDLILIYDAPAEAASDGAVSLSPTTYYTRLVQRLVNALTAPTAEGTLYEVDMRLRPSGNAGPLAAALESFIRYHRDSSWTWEHQALTRARVVAGDAVLGDKVARVVRDTLCRRRDPGALVRDVALMRERIHASRPAPGPWDIKYREGGTIDLDFILQYLLLRHAADHPELANGGAEPLIARACELRLLPVKAADALFSTRRLWSALLILIRLTLDSDCAEADFPSGLKETLVRATHSVDFADLKRQMEVSAAAVADVYRQIIAAPAAAVPPPSQESP